MLNLKKITFLIVSVLLVTGAIFIWWNSQKPLTREDTIKNQIFSIITSFDFNDPQSFYSISEIGDLGEETLPILQDLIKSESVSERWAAIILLPRILRANESLRGSIVPSLKQEMSDKDDTLKMLASAQLVSLGEKEGILTLISCLNSEKTTHFGDPPELVKERSLIYLQHYTDYDGRTIKAWQEWWESNKDLLLWNKALEIFEVK